VNPNRQATPLTLPADKVTQGDILLGLMQTSLRSRLSRMPHDLHQSTANNDTQLTQHATHESKTNYTLLYAKGHSAQPGMFWRTPHTKSDPKSMRVMPLCLWGV
jgi:hypothetical protein